MENEKKKSFGICKASEVDEEERTVVAIISTGAIDRDSEVLSPKGIDIEDFRKNPVIPWSHNTYDPPIGKALWVKKGTKRITAKVKFAMTERAEEVWQLFKGGFLNAFSVGFMPTEGHRPTPDEIKKRPELAEARFIYDKWKLLEFSPVTVPANPEALAQAIKSKSISLSEKFMQDMDLEFEDDEGEKQYCHDVLIPVKELVPVIEVEIPVEPVFTVDEVVIGG